VRSQFFRHRTGFGVPDLFGILRDGAVARELTGACHIGDHLARPGLVLGVKLEQPTVGDPRMSALGQKPTLWRSLIVAAKLLLVGRTPFPPYKVAPNLG